MNGAILDGRVIASDLLRALEARVARLAGLGVHPHLVFVMIGDSREARIYANRLEKLAAPIGIRVTRHVMRVEITPDELETEVRGLNDDPEVDGILVQMPLPAHLTLDHLSPLIDPHKDVDGITIHNAGCLYLGLPGQWPSTASAMMHILDWAGIDPMGQHAVVVGRSNVVGHPVAELLLNRDATVTVTHRQTKDLASFTRQAEILIVAAGEARLIGPDMVRAGAVVVDAGINPTPDGVVGDVDFQACRPVVSAITPVPGGVGPVTNAVLLRHLVESAEHRES